MLTRITGTDQIDASGYSFPFLLGASGNGAQKRQPMHMPGMTKSKHLRDHAAERVTSDVRSSSADIVEQGFEVIRQKWQGIRPRRARAFAVPAQVITQHTVLIREPAGHAIPIVEPRANTMDQDNQWSLAFEHKARFDPSVIENCQVAPILRLR